MFTTPLQRLGFVVGCLWFAYCFLIFAFALAEVNMKWVVRWGFLGTVPTIVLWWITGTLKPVVSWFKGTNKA